jgi:hypothetical protein
MNLPDSTPQQRYAAILGIKLLHCGKMHVMEHYFTAIKGSLGESVKFSPFHYSVTEDLYLNSFMYPHT